MRKALGLMIAAMAVFGIIVTAGAVAKTFTTPVDQETAAGSSSFFSITMTDSGSTCSPDIVNSATLAITSDFISSIGTNPVSVSQTLVGTVQSGVFSWSGNILDPDINSQFNPTAEFIYWLPTTGPDASSITAANNGAILPAAVDDASHAPDAAVSEPGTLLVLGCSLIGAAVLKKKSGKS